MTPQQIEAMKLALEALKTLMLERGSIYDKAITAIEEALAEHAMRETQRLGQEIEPKIGCVNHDCDQCKAQPEQEPWKPTEADYKEWWDRHGLHGPTARAAFEDAASLYLTATPPQRTEPLPQKKVWTFWDLSGGDITDAIKAKLKEKNT